MSKRHIHEEMIVDYLLNNLSGEEHFAVTRHLKRCKKCSLETDAWRKFLFNETIVTPSKGAKHKLTDTITHWQQKKTPRYIFAIATVLLVVIVAPLFFQFSNEQLVIDENQTLSSQSIVVNKNPVRKEQTLTTIPLNQIFTNNPNHLTNVNWEDKQAFIHLNDKIEQQEEQVLILRDGSVCLFNEQTLQLTCYKLLPRK